MLATLRRHSNSWAFKLILGLLAASFAIGFGLLTTGGPTSKEAAVAVRVNGEPITNRELEITYQRLYQDYQRRLGDQLTEDLLKQLNLRFQALNLLINRQVALDEARRLGFEVSDQEVLAAIARIPAFQDAAGNFDPNRYRFVLSQQRPPIRPAEFEAELRDQLLVEKLQRFVEDLAHVRNEEVLRDFLIEETKVDLYLMRFEPERYRDKVRIATRELRAYYDEHRDEFSSGQRARVRVATVPVAVLEREVKVAPTEVEAYYQEHAEEFRGEEAVKARHILLKVPPDADEQQIAAVRKRIEKIKREVGDDLTAFEEAARTYGQDGTARRGGDLGWFGRGQMVPPFEEAAFAAAPGTVTGPVRTRFGWHLIYVEEHRAGGQRPLEEVRDEIERKLRRRKAAEEARAAIETLRSRLAAGQSFADAVSDLPVDVEEAWVAENDPDAAVRFPRQVLDEIFAGEGAEIGPGGRLVEADGDLYFVQVLERGPAEPRPFEQVKEQIRARLLDDRALALAAEQAAAALEALGRGADPRRVARRYGVELERTGPFNQKVREIPLLGKAPELLKVAFTLTREQPVPRRTFRIGGAYVVVALADRTDPDPESFRERLPELRRQALEQRRQALWQAWMQTARGRAEIETENPPADLLPPA